jgi:hypothetical protein
MEVKASFAGKKIRRFYGTEQEAFEEGARVVTLIRNKGTRGLESENGITVAQAALSPDTQQEIVASNAETRGMGMLDPEVQAEVAASQEDMGLSFMDELKTVNLPYFVGMFLFY